MGVSSITHGTTLSYSHAIANPDILCWRNINTTYWDANDCSIASTLLATLSGMDEHRHFMMNSTDSLLGTGCPGKASYVDELPTVLDKYSQKASELKQAYEAKIMENREEFNESGWILSDFCTGGFDGKQLTATANI